jgi:nucleoside-diphosphate-sugar epimerase
VRYWITGATGFIGSHLIKKLIDSGHQCRCLVRSRHKSKELEKLGVELVEGDITLPESLKGMAKGMDAVFHLATLGHMSNFSISESMFEAVNVQGTVNVMEEALRARVQRAIHCSTVAAMGICSDVPATEASHCNPHHSYGRSKLKAEQKILAMSREENLPVVIVRFSMVFGPGDNRDILRLTRLTKKGLFPEVGKRPKLTPLIHVDDAVQGLILAAEKGATGEIYLLTNQQALPFDEIRKTLQQALGIKRPPLYVPEWAALFIASLVEIVWPIFGKNPPVSRKNIESTLADRVFSIKKAQTQLGFEPKVDPVEGLTETVRWYQQHGWV